MFLHIYIYFVILIFFVFSLYDDEINLRTYAVNVSSRFHLIVETMMFSRSLFGGDIKNQSLKKKIRYYRRILLNEIDEKVKHLKLQLVKEHALLKDIINPYKCLLKSANFSIKTNNEYITLYSIK